MLADADPVLRRLQRTAVVACLVMAGAAFAVSGGNAGTAAAVLGGGLLIGISYTTIGAGATSLVTLLAPPPGGQPSAAPVPAPRVGRTVLALAGRYALLALLAYVMIARLRLHPIGLLAGASSVVAAAAIEAARLLFKKV